MTAPSDGDGSRADATRTDAAHPDAARSLLPDLDPVDRLALDEAADALAGDAPADAATRIRLVVVGDLTGALTIEAARRFGVDEVRVFVDGVDAERRVTTRATEQAHDPERGGLAVRCLGLEPALVEGATLVVGRLPKHHAELEELVGLLATHADDRVHAVLAGRIKHMSRGLNDALALGFDHVRASLGRQKSRALHARSPRRDHAIRPFPRWARLADLDVDVAAHGGAFAGATLDIGTRALLDVLEPALESAGVAPDAEGRAVDLGCGTGLLATALARSRPRMRVTATDRSWAACASARETADRAGLAERIEVVRDDAAASIGDASVDLVLLNPPFHDGTTVDDVAAEPLFRAAARILRPGGTLLTVFNAHLPHRTALRRIVGPTEQVARTAKFIVTRSTAGPQRRGGA